MKLRKLNNNILPYPVLSEENEDVRPSLKDIESISIKHEVKTDTFCFTVKLLQLNDTIKKLIEDNKAKYMFVLTCPTTVFQERKLSSEPEITIEINKLSVNGHLDFDCFVVLTENITYSNIGFADIYEGLSIDLEAGNILVRFPHRETNMDLSNEKMFVSKAFVEFVKSNKEEVELEFDTDVINIFLPEKQYEDYLEFRNNSLYSDLIISSIVHEAIIMAIIGYDDDTHGTLRWADALNTLVYIVTDKQYTLKGMSKEERIRRAWELSNLVLRHPHERLFDSILKIDSEMNSENTLIQ